MSEGILTYRSAGVDVDINNETNDRIKAYIKRTHNPRVITKTGLFSGGIGIGEFKELKNPVLIGALGIQKRHRYLIQDYNEESCRLITGEIIDTCRENLPATAENIAFLDYIASSELNPAKVEYFIRGFADHLSREPKTPIIGGETAEMPGIFKKGAWEVIGALYGIAEKRLFNQPETAGLSTEFIDIAGIRAYSRPALVFSMDGVGTKTKLGIMMKKTDGLALDIIHHSLNDILCQGAKGIAMMFYIGCNTLDRELINPFVKVVKACQKDDGFRTLSLSIAENRDLYTPGEYDICASIAGLVDSERIIQGSGIMAGDQIIGLASSGLHTNGYSLARKALLEKAGLKLEQHMHELDAALGEVLLIPHKNYVPAVMPLLQDEEISKAVKGIAHITGGGLQDNLARILPYGLGADIQKSSWQPQSIFAIIRKSGNIPYHDPVHKGMYETFNMGIGMAVIVDKEKTDQVSSLLHSSGEEARIIGRVVLNAAESAQERIRLLS